MTYSIIPETTRDLTPDLMPCGVYVVPPARYFEGTTPHERALFGHRHAMYTLPTVESVDWIRAAIGSRFAVEIGAGVGVLARALGIMATDNHLQTFPTVASAYQAQGQPVIRYGENVARICADTVARELRPAVIVGAWITHAYDPGNHSAGGSIFAPNFALLLSACADLILICNTRTHAQHPLLRRAHDRITPPWLYSRAMGGEDFIGIWKGAGGRVAP